VIKAPARQWMNARISWDCKNAPVIGALAFQSDDGGQNDV